MKKFFLACLSLVIFSVSCEKEPLEGVDKFYFNISGPEWNGAYTITDKEDFSERVFGSINEHVPYSDRGEFVEVHVSAMLREISSETRMIPKIGVQILVEDQEERRMELSSPEGIHLISSHVRLQITAYENEDYFMDSPDLLKCNFNGSMKYSHPDSSGDVTHTIEGGIELYH